MTETLPSVPAPPNEPELNPDHPLTVLRSRLLTVLSGLPAFFEFDNNIRGVISTDLFALNTLLGASIEGQVVKTLNQQRKLWDPEDDWQGYQFIRQSQRFPDVLLTRGGQSTPDVALGIEMKGWFLISKELEPSFRFKTTPAACAPHDLLCVVPWYLDNVLSGSPVAAEPWVVSSRWMAEWRNHYWANVRNIGESGSPVIDSPSGVAPYQQDAAKSSDAPAKDSGNFGRLARYGPMDDFINDSNNLEVLGIRIRDWATFLKLHSDQRDPEVASTKLEKDLSTALRDRSGAQTSRIVDALEVIVDAYGHS